MKNPKQMFKVFSFLPQNISQHKRYKFLYKVNILNIFWSPIKFYNVIYLIFNDTGSFQDIYLKKVLA